MLNIGIDTAKSRFLDRVVVTTAAEGAQQRVQMRWGGYVRTVARWSQRRRKGVASAGQPPYAHVGFLRDFLYFDRDQRTGSVVAGPVPLTGRRATVPRLMEDGGAMSIMAGRQRGRVGHYSPHPYMAPAAKAANERLPGWLAGSVKG